jgi:hypothetical protein
MNYILPSNIVRKFTNGGEYVERSTGKNYVGPYVTINERFYFSGENMSETSIELVPVPSPVDLPPVNEYDFYSNFKNYDIKSFKPLYYSHNPPSQKDYEKGSYRRYFAKNNLIKVGGITEIDYITFTDLIKKNGTYDYHKYSPFYIQWDLVSSEKNKSTILSLSNRYHGLQAYLKNPNQFVK